MTKDYAHLENKVKDLEKRLIVLEQQAINLRPAENKQKKISIKEYIIKHVPKNDVQCALVIAGYLEQEKGYSSFNADDIKKGFRLARIPQPSNTNDKINMNVSRGYMMEDEAKKDGKKAWVLTTTGEGALESDSDREKS